MTTTTDTRKALLRSLTNTDRAALGAFSISYNGAQARTEGGTGRVWCVKNDVTGALLSEHRRAADAVANLMHRHAGAMPATDDDPKAIPCAALVARYHGPGNVKGARISVRSQHSLGVRWYNYDHGAPSPWRAAVAQYLAEVWQINTRRGQAPGEGWGTVSDYVEGVTPDGDHVFCQARERSQ